MSTTGFLDSKSPPPAELRSPNVTICVQNEHLKTYSNQLIASWWAPGNKPVRRVISSFADRASQYIYLSN